MLTDLKFIVLWWLTIFLLGLVLLPLTSRIFSRFWDRGYIFAKTIALGLTTYLVFVSGVFHLLPFTLSTILIVVLLLTIISYKLSPNFFDDLRQKYLIFFCEEIIFFSILALWSYVRGFAPAIEGLEKYMDWGFVNSALRSRFMPPLDMWFALKPINYYYFGHLIFALVTKVSHIPSAITYNLSIATVCALTFVSTFSLASNLVFVSLKKASLRLSIIAGLVSGLLLTFGGNLHTVYKIAKIDITTNGRLDLSPQAIKTAASSYWYPDATRFIGFDPDVNDKTIHEFPLYSFVVADLHGHMNDIPIVLFFVAFLLAVYLSPPSRSLFNWVLIIPASLTLSIAYMTNAWDFAVYGLLFAISYFLNLLTDHSSLVTVVKKTFINGFLIIIFWYLFTLPFSLNFTPMAEGLKLADAHTPFYQLFILYGGFWLICLPFIILFKKLHTDHRSLMTDYFVLALIITATILIIIPEIGYLKDIYVYDHRRANTMFKLVYQAFMLYALASGYLLSRLSRFKAYKFLFLLVFVCHLIYPYFAIRSYYGLKDYQGLWGLTYLQNLYPDSLAAIDWLNTHVTGQPVIVEAVGDSYTTFNHLSSATGLPTIQGWVVHEWLWRGGYDEPGARTAEVQQIYESNDIDAVHQLLLKYSVKYIIVGPKEVEKYPHLNEDNFVTLGANLVFQSGSTKIYQL